MVRTQLQWKRRLVDNCYSVQIITKDSQGNTLQILHLPKKGNLRLAAQPFAVTCLWFSTASLTLRAFEFLAEIFYHQYRTRPICTSLQSDQTLYCRPINVFFLVSSKLTMNSSTFNVRNCYFQTS